jgi:glycosyltransferase involved in cell wall biosynthesis
MNPTVSVIVPTYNGERYLCQTIESALRQTMKDVETIVVDDGSDSDLTGCLAPYSGRIRYVRIERSGPAAARNAGIRHSRGKYIALLDHDDLWHPDNLRRQVEVLDQHPRCSLVYSYPTLIDENGSAIANEGPSYFPAGDVLLDFLHRNRITTFSATLIRSSILDSVGLLDESPEVTTCDDYDLWLRIAEMADVLFVPGEWVQYRIHPGNLLKNHAQNLRAREFVLTKALTGSARLHQMSRRTVMQITKENRYDSLRRFAYIFYYQTDGVRQARALFWKALVLKPHVLRDVPFLLACYLPKRLRSLAGSLRSCLGLARR